MAEIRIIGREERDEAVRLSNRTFRSPEQSSMGAAFPQVFSPELGQSYGVFEDGRLAAFMGLVPTVVKLGSASVHAMQLGSVCTAEEYRGRNYASSLLERVIAHADRAGAALLLVSGGRGLYRRAGCHPYGRSDLFELTPASIGEGGVCPDGASCRELAAEDWFHLHRLASARRVRHDASLAELAVLLEAKAWASILGLSHRVVLAERGGLPLAFAVIGVPQDPADREKPARLIEWGGDPEAASMLIAESVGRFGLARLTVPLPWHDRELAAALRPLSEEVKPETDRHTVKILNPERLVGQLMPYLMEMQAHYAIDFSLRGLPEGGATLYLGGRTAEVSGEELVSLFFDPDGMSSLDADFRRELAGLLPVPLPYEKGLNYV